MKMKRKICCILLAAMQCILLFSVTLSAQNAEGIAESGYQTAKAENAQEDIVLVTDTYTVLSENDTKEFIVDIPADAAYCFILSFYPTGDNMKGVNYALTVDGKLPFDGADALRADFDAQAVLIAMRMVASASVASDPGRYADVVSRGLRA